MILVSRLRLVLNAESYDYSDDTLQVGFRLLLHTQRDRRPFIGYNTDDIVVTAGTHHSVRVAVCCLLCLINPLTPTVAIFVQPSFARPVKPSFVIFDTGHSDAQG